jgi:hypothetical protein
MNLRRWLSRLAIVLLLAAGLAAPPATADITLWAWGFNNNGQLGDGTLTDHASPVQAVVGLTGIKAVAAGQFFTLALKEDGTVWSWGDNSYGQLGDGTMTDSLVPVQVVGLTGVTAIACGSEHALALKSDGTVWAWGTNYCGALGDNTEVDSAVPVQAYGISDVTAIAAGYWFSMALMSDGTIGSWGDNYWGTLGDGTDLDCPYPIYVQGISDAVAIACGDYQGFAIHADGTVSSWGCNIMGQLGQGTADLDAHMLPVKVLNIDNVKQVVGGARHTVALKKDGSVWTWGWNMYGQLGVGVAGDSYTPVPITTLSGITSIAAGGYHNLALKSDATVVSWGQGSYKAIGDGATEHRLAPVAVPGLAGVTAIKCGRRYSLALLAPQAKAPTSVYAPARSGIITTTVALKGYLKRTSDNAWVSGRTLEFTVAGTAVGSATTSAAGEAILNWVIADGAASRTIGVGFAGDASYEPSSTTATLTAQTVATKVYVVDRTQKIKQYTVLKAYLYLLNNTIVASKPMTVKVDGTALGTLNTNASGYVQFGYTVPEGAGDGVRVIRGEFAGDGGYNASANTGKLTVTQGNLYIWPYIRSGKVGTNLTLKAYVRSLPDYVIQPGKAIAFSVNGTPVGTANVAADGWASVTWAIPAGEPTGSHTGSAAFAGDSWYAAVTANTAFNVVP